MIGVVELYQIGVGIALAYMLLVVFSDGVNGHQPDLFVVDVHLSHLTAWGWIALSIGWAMLWPVTVIRYVYKKRRRLYRTNDEEQTDA